LKAAKTKARRQGKLRKPPTISEHEARYGADASSSLLWDILNAREQLQYCREENAPALSPPLMRELFRRGVMSGHEWLALGLFEKAARAIQKGDASLFREIARLIEEHIAGPLRHRMEQVAIPCMAILESHKSRPTKRDLRNMCLRWRAEEIVTSRSGASFNKRFHYVNGRLNYRPAFAAKIENELRLLEKKDAARTWNWTQIFKRVGAADWPADKGGQPSHRSPIRTW
jgi:hypothetical protein